MPVTKFRSFDEARRALWLDSGDEQILERIKRLSELATPRPARPHGVFRYKTIEEAKSDRD